MNQRRIYKQVLREVNRLECFGRVYNVIHVQCSQNTKASRQEFNAELNLLEKKHDILMQSLLSPHNRTQSHWASYKLDYKTCL